MIALLYRITSSKSVSQAVPAPKPPNIKLLVLSTSKELTPEIAERAMVLANLKKQIATAKVNAQRAATIKAQEKIEANK